MKTGNLFIGIVIAFIATLFIVSLSKDSEKQEIIRKLEEALANQKLELLKSQKLVRESDSLNSIFINDTKNLKDLVSLLEKDNKDLAKKLKSRDEKLVIYSKMIVKLEEKYQSTLTDSLNNFSVHYPSEDRWILKYSGTAHSEFKVDSISGNWNSKAFDLNLMVTEVTPGLYKAYIQSFPEFQFTDIDFQSLPLGNDTDNGILPNKKKKSLFGLQGWKLGGGYYQSTKDGIKSTGFEILGGPSFQKFDLILRAQPTETSTSPRQFGGAILLNL